MENIIEFICSGSPEFTPRTLCGLLLFCSALECIGCIARSLVSAGRR